jgi:hypothetical protein
MLSMAQLGFLLLARQDLEGAKPLLEKVLVSGDEPLADRVRKALNLPQTMSRQPETSPSKVSVEAKTMAERSLQAGYLKDAEKYLHIAHQMDPADFTVMLNLGRTYNVLKQDEQALLWFDLARRSPDPAVAKEADRAYRNLSPSFKRFQTTFWILPFYSSRWKDAFAYSQIKTEIRLKRLPLIPYLSVRFSGDAKQTAGTVVPQYLSESSFIIGVGIRTKVHKGIFAWMEAGSDVSYLDRRDRTGHMAPDYRGGVSFTKGLGQFLGGEASGAFFETMNDGVFVSRFDNTFLGSFRNRFGYTPPTVGTLGGLQTQFYWNGNATVDTKRQAWANFLETGPGFRFRWDWMPRSLLFSIDLVRGHYLLDYAPKGRNYTDVRGGLWYAFSR